MNHENFSLAVLVVDLIQNDGGSTRFRPRPTAIEIAAVAAGIGIDHPVESEATESCILEEVCLRDEWQALCQFPQQ